MDDVVAITPRVLVIDQGKMSYDGSLEGLVKKTRPEKLLTLRFGTPVDRARLESLGGKILSHDASHAVLQVDAPQLKEAVALAISDYPVVDLKVEDAPLEEVLSDLFAKNRPAEVEPS
jgi:ABC-2 type transport system ATP-binding protein